jgi:formylglycine-generating enzyme required for sulfatase activity
VATGMGKGTLFPWGDSPPTCETSALGRVDDMLELLPECESTEMIRVTEPMGDRVSVSGHDEVWQMGGSVSEWTFDSFTPYWNTETDNNCWQKQGVFLHPFCELDTRPVCEEHYPSSNMADLSFTVRGGNFIDPLSHAYSALRRSERGGTQSPKIGFRCVYFPGQNDPKSKVRPNSDSQSGDVECAGDGP